MYPIAAVAAATAFSWIFLLSLKVLETLISLLLISWLLRILIMISFRCGEIQFESSNKF